jgi:hypothetical protein
VLNILNDPTASPGDLRTAKKTATVWSETIATMVRCGSRYATEGGDLVLFYNGLALGAAAVALESGQMFALAGVAMTAVAKDFPKSCARSAARAWLRADYGDFAPATEAYNRHCA